MYYKSMEELIREMEHELDRSKLFNDPMSKATLEVSLARWISRLKDIEDELLEKGAAESCLIHDSDIAELRASVVDYEERIRQVKEIL